MKVTTHQDGTQSAEFTTGLDMKAVTTTVDDETGDLYIEGWASDFNPDRQDEAFEPGAFTRGLKSFMDTNPILLYHHKYDQALGQVVDANLSDEGLRVKARVDKPAIGSWAEDVFNKVKKGTIRAFSVGGIFRRKLTENGWRIHDVDLGEISVTPFPVNPRTTFAVVAGKAFEEADARVSADDTTAEIEKALARLDGVFTTLEGKANKSEDLGDNEKYTLARFIHSLQRTAEDARGIADTTDHEKLKAAALAVHAAHTSALKELHRLAAKHSPLPAVSSY